MTVWIAFDTETTGLIDNLSKPERLQPEIIEFYGCAFDPATGEIARELSTLVKPKREIPEEIIRITSITNEMVNTPGTPIFEEIADTVESFLGSADVLLAHNLSFDLDVLSIEYGRMERRFPIRARKLCTVEQSVAEKGYRLSLTALHEYLFNEPFPEAHRAKADVAALVRCATEMKSRGLIA